LFETNSPVDSAVSFRLFDTKDFRGSDDTIAKLSVLEMPHGLVCGSDHLTMDRFVGLKTSGLHMDDSGPNAYQKNKTPWGGEFDIEHFWLSVK
jgi:hypothetical protein